MSVCCQFPIFPQGSSRSCPPYFGRTFNWKMASAASSDEGQHFESYSTEHFYSCFFHPESFIIVDLASKWKGKRQGWQGFLLPVSLSVLINTSLLLINYTWGPILCQIQFPALKPSNIVNTIKWQWAVGKNWLKASCNPSTGWVKSPTNSSPHHGK